VHFNKQEETERPVFISMENDMEEQEREEAEKE
jgi:hypothetical protein